MNHLRITKMYFFYPFSTLSQHEIFCIHFENQVNTKILQLQMIKLLILLKKYSNDNQIRINIFEITTNVYNHKIMY